MPTPNILPPKYYLDYYTYILRYVEHHYKDMLAENEKQFIAKLHKAKEDSLCLYLRIAGRRSIFFRPSQLQYDEIADTNKAIKELLKLGLIQTLNEAHQEQSTDWLNTFTKPQLWEVLNQIHKVKKKSDNKSSNKSDKPTLPSKQTSKALLVDFVVQNVDFPKLIKHFNQTEKTIVQNKLEEETMIRYLFFGHSHGSIIDFVVRDIWDQPFEQIDEKHFTPYFKTRTEIDQCFQLSMLNREWNALQEMKSKEDTDEIEQVKIAKQWFQNWFDSDTIWTEKAQVKLDKILLKVGRFFERKKELDLALQAYQHTVRQPSRERQARIYLKQKNMDKIQMVCNQILEAPQSIKETIFAKDFIRKISEKKSIKSTRKKLKEADIVTLPQKWKYSVETGVLKHFVRKKYNGLHAENTIWRGLFGVVFWDLIYDPTAGSIHNALQSLPSDFYHPDFYKKRQEKIAKCLEILDDEKAFQNHLTQIFEQKWGINNRLIVWSYDLLEVLQEMYRKMSPKQLKAVLQKICKNPKDNLAGFPDLFIWKKRAYWFIEVKSPTDMLSEQQLFWIEFMQAQNIKAKVLKVKWKE